jgi:hypothetical protein
MVDSAYKKNSLKEFLISLKKRYPTAHVFRSTEHEFILVDDVHHFVKLITRDSKGKEIIKDQKEIFVNEK